MEDDDRAPDWSGDDYDESLARRFRQLDQVAAPDVWDRVVAGPRHDRSTVARQRHRGALLGVAAVVTAVLGGAVVFRVVTDRSNGATVTVGQAERGEGAPVGCVGSDIVGPIYDGAPVSVPEPSESPADLVESADLVIRGHLTPSIPGGGSTVVRAKVGDIEGEWVDDGLIDLILPAVPAGPIDGSIVAFVTSPTAPSGPWTVLDEGLWIGCRSDTPAESAFAAPTAAGWRDLLDGGVTLDELWQEVRLPGGERRQPLAAPLVTDEGDAVFDLRLASGERLRVSVPAEAADELTTVVERAEDRGPISLEGGDMTVSIEFELCADQDAMVENRLGSAVRHDEGVIRVCRADELLSTTVETSLDVSTSLDSFDVRLISDGSRHGPIAAAQWPQYAECGNCLPWGPMSFPEVGVVVNKTGSTRITAVDVEDLAEVWTVDTGGFDTYLHGGPDAVYVDITGGEFQRLDPATGAVEWGIEREPGERQVSLSGSGSATWLLRSSFAGEGDNRAPVIRSIDIVTGQVIWSAEGRSGAEWSEAVPVQIGEVVVVLEAGPDGRRDRLRAFDGSSGAGLWATDLDNADDLVVLDFEDGPALIVETLPGGLVRVDPGDGTVSWQTATLPYRLDGTVFSENGALAIGLRANELVRALDPATGALVVPAE